MAHLSQVSIMTLNNGGGALHGFEGREKPLLDVLKDADFSATRQQVRIKRGWSVIKVDDPKDQMVQDGDKIFLSGKVSGGAN